MADGEYICAGTAYLVFKKTWYKIPLIVVYDILTDITKEQWEEQKDQPVYRAESFYQWLDGIHYDLNYRLKAKEIKDLLKEKVDQLKSYIDYPKMKEMSDSVQINKESIDSYQEILTNPSTYGLSFRPIQECFIKAETVTAKHILASEFIKNEAPNLPKLVCYIIMDNLFGFCDGKDPNGDLGYHLTFIPKVA